MDKEKWTIYKTILFRILGMVVVLLYVIYKYLLMPRILINNANNSTHDGFILLYTIFSMLRYASLLIFIFLIVKSAIDIYVRRYEAGESVIKLIVGILGLALVSFI